MSGIVVVGGGAMGEALISGWIASGVSADEVAVVEPSPQRAADLAARHGIAAIALEDAGAADTVVLAVKPNTVVKVLSVLNGRLSPGALVVSIAAGVPLAVLEGALPGVAVVRVMPNTPALLGKGMAGIVPGEAATEEHTARVVDLMEAVGKALVIDEPHLDALTAISGSGPAYLFYVAEAMIEAGVHQGLSRGESTTLTNQTFVGAAAMLAESGRSATELREMVTSPAGTTAAALRVLDDAGVRSGFLAAVQACHDRSAEMARS
ncbi:MAG: pyrroline-5-carboxylate reductase [Tessaracoccus sp.]|uniref:pyrroline-5-carboxylate reductase n=1 Tax=Tessaracoccus sp. TaxID=1971211 RepID=UPI001ED1248F|nr:pyrroline-5-carboxylate reductase [Tessaracoccus sp.]MBK7822621.1 pyrroline-5-carboxylate reductase [Tessaracoccus sp.]